MIPIRSASVVNTGDLERVDIEEIGGSVKNGESVIKSYGKERKYPS